MDRETELALVRRLGDGDPGAFDAVYDEYRARVYNFLARLSRSRDVADDLAEETWLRLVANAGRLRPDTRLGPWLFTVARNLYFSYCRSRLLADTNAGADCLVCGRPPARPSPFDEVAAGELRTPRRAGTGDTAGKRYREVDSAGGSRGAQPRRGGGRLRLTAEALRQRLSRGRAMLARALDAHGAQTGSESQAR